MSNYNFKQEVRAGESSVTVEFANKSDFYEYIEMTEGRPTETLSDKSLKKFSALTNGGYHV